MRAEDLHVMFPHALHGESRGVALSQPYEVQAFVETLMHMHQSFASGIESSQQNASARSRAANLVASRLLISNRCGSGFLH